MSPFECAALLLLPVLILIYAASAIPQIRSLLTDALSSLLQNTLHCFSLFGRMASPAVDSQVVMSPAEAMASFKSASRGVEGLIKSIEKNKRSLPAVVIGLRDDLVPLVPLLEKVGGAVKNSECELALSHDAQFLLRNCDRICQKHSNNIRLLPQDHINTLKAQLGSFKNVLGTLLQTSNCLKTARQDYMTKEMVDPMLLQMERMIERQILGVRTEQGELTRYAPPPNRDDILAELRHQRKSYEAIQNICEEALKKTVYQRTGQKIFNIKAHDKSVTLTGFVNAEEEESRIDQEISDVAAAGYSIAVAGVVKNIDYVALAGQMRKMK